MYDETKSFNDPNVRSGQGSGYYIWDEKLNKFKLAFVSEEVSTPTGDVDEIEYNPTTSTTATKIAGGEKLNAIEIPIPAHRDNYDFVEAQNRKTSKWMSTYGDGIGKIFYATLTYKDGTRKNGEIALLTVKLTPTSKPEYVRITKPLIIPTAKFEDMETNIILPTKTSKVELSIPVYPTNAKVSAISENTGICTATYANNKLTITGVSEGYTIISLETSLEGYASMKRTILVQVPSDSAPTV